MKRFLVATFVLLSFLFLASVPLYAGSHRSADLVSSRSDPDLFEPTSPEYRIKDLSHYVEGWQPDNYYDQKHLFIEKCGSTKYWVSAEYYNQSTPETKWRRAIIDVKTGEMQTFYGQLPYHNITGIAYNGDTVYLSTFDHPYDRGHVFKLINGAFIDLTPLFTQYGYFYRAYDIQFNGQYFLVISPLGNLYKLTLDDQVTKYDTDNGYEFGSMMWDRTLKKWWISPYGDYETALFDGTNFEIVYEGPAYATFSNRQEVILLPHQTLYQNQYIHGGHINLCRQPISINSALENVLPVCTEVPVPEELTGMNQYQRSYHVAGMTWTGSVWLMYVSDGYDETKIYTYSSNDNVFTHVMDLELGLSWYNTVAQRNVFGTYHTGLYHLVYKDSRYHIDDL